MVLGSGSADIAPISITTVTTSIGILGSTRTNSPKMFVPITAPTLAATKCTPEAVVLSKQYTKITSH